MTDRRLLDLAKTAAGAALKAGAKDARVQISRTREVNVEWRDGKLDRVRESTRQSLSIALFVEGRYSSNSTSDMRDNAVEEYVRKAVAATRYLAADENRRLPDPSRYERKAPADLQIKDPALDLVAPEDRLSAAKKIEEAARSGDDQGKIVSVTSSAGDDETRSVFFSTNGLEAEEEGTNFWRSAWISVKDADNRALEGASLGWTRFVADMPPCEQIAADARKRATDRIGSRQIPSGVYEMVIENRAVPTLAKHLLRCLSGPLIQQKSSFLESYMGREIASQLLTITDDPHLARGLASTAWDGEGMATQARDVVQKGVLKTFFLDTYYASKLGVEPTTANTSNLIWSTGKRGAQPMVRAMKQGIFATGFQGGNSNATTGDFSIGIKGFYVKKGKLAHPISGMSMAGNHLTFWKDLAELGNDPWKYSPIMCPTLRFTKVQCSGGNINQQSQG